MTKQSPKSAGPDPKFENFQGTSEPGKLTSTRLRKVVTSSGSRLAARGRKSGATTERNLKAERNGLEARRGKIELALRAFKLRYNEEHDRIREEYRDHTPEEARAAWIKRRAELDDLREPLLSEKRQVAGELQEVRLELKRLLHKEQVAKAGYSAELPDLLRYVIRQEFGDLTELRKVMCSFLGQSRGLEKVAKRVESWSEYLDRIADRPHVMLNLAYAVYQAVSARHPDTEIFTKGEQDVFSLIGVYLQLFGKMGLPTS